MYLIYEAYGGREAARESLTTVKDIPMGVPTKKSEVLKKVYLVENAKVSIRIKWFFQHLYALMFAFILWANDLKRA